MIARGIRDESIIGLAEELEAMRKKAPESSQLLAELFCAVGTLGRACFDPEGTEGIKKEAIRAAALAIRIAEESGDE